MSEQQEALVRSQAFLMFARNQGKTRIIKKVLNRFLKCIRIRS